MRKNGKTLTRANYLTDEDLRICEGCAEFTSCRMAGYHMLVHANGTREHFCSHACLQALINNPGIPMVTKRSAIIQAGFAIAFGMLVGGSISIIVNIITNAR